MSTLLLQQKNRGFEYTFKVFETTLKSGKWRAERESVEPWGMLGDGNARGGHRPPRHPKSCSDHSLIAISNRQQSPGKSIFEFSVGCDLRDNE